MGCPRRFYRKERDTSTRVTRAMAHQNERHAQVKRTRSGRQVLTGKNTRDRWRWRSWKNHRRGEELTQMIRTERAEACLRPSVLPSVRPHYAATIQWFFQRAVFFRKINCKNTDPKLHILYCTKQPLFRNFCTTLKQNLEGNICVNKSRKHSTVRQNNYSRQVIQ